MPFGLGLEARAGGPRWTTDVLTPHFLWPPFVPLFKMNLKAVMCFLLTFSSEGVIGLFDSCIHGGTEYREGDYFLPNDTIIKTEGPRECVQCRCRQGLVICEIEHCPPLTCEAPVRNSHLCCLRCPGSAKESEENSELVIKTGEVDADPKKSTDSDCFLNGKRFRNGSAWQPVIGPFGVMACVDCRCREGVVFCGRLQCSPPPCPQPRRQLGQCCPVCPSSDENKKRAFCLPRLNELFVFRTGNVHNDSDRIEYAFLDKERKSDLVKIHSWNLQAKNSMDVFTFSLVPRKELRDRNLRILGSISKRRFRKYSKKEKKLRNNCAAKCLTKIERLENSLVDHSVSAKSECREDEVNVAEFFGEA